MLNLEKINKISKKNYYIEIVLKFLYQKNAKCLFKTLAF
ncbi:hypothetical protein SAMN05421866_4304 [Chryseobacterium oranimense]|jgi:hypothetical protein|uniref:Uncharacterized protein n=1 Tax=Chryseobacterium oranimense TaxID=421058 RepID=A0A1M5X1C8_9FLAO|nr:hypothetical protein BN1195_03150 [Chryseobacterium oranimense G311]SHH93581.1 hypothetical protein SAMN05421866_4304 [Chryseobacterium oranimense]